jgi:hypothetical protein
MLKISDAVVYVDPHGVARGAVLCTIWGQGTTGGWHPEKDAHGNTVATDEPAPPVNLVFTSGDAGRRDNGGMGRQVERASSVPHMSRLEAHGNYWRRLDEPGKATETAA